MRCKRAQTSLPPFSLDVTRLSTVAPIKRAFAVATAYRVTSVVESAGSRTPLYLTSIVFFFSVPVAYSRSRKLWELPPEPGAPRLTLWQRMAHSQRTCDPTVCPLCVAELRAAAEEGP